MARSGLMDDEGYKGFDDAEWQKCGNCKHFCYNSDDVKVCCCKRSEYFGMAVGDTDSCVDSWDMD